MNIDTSIKQSLYGKTRSYGLRANCVFVDVGNRTVDQPMIQKNYVQMKRDILGIIGTEMEQIANDLVLAALIVRKQN